MEEDYAKRSERVKALLSQYYGDGSAGPAAGAPGQSAQQPSAAPGRGQQGGHVAGLAAIDTPTFNADQHTSDILRIFSLEKLMVEHRNMAREIKNLDSDMQQLVYENYNKFITATDTIRTMKSSVDNMESEMQRLEQTASEGGLGRAGWVGTQTAKGKGLGKAGWKGCMAGAAKTRVPCQLPEHQAYPSPAGVVAEKSLSVSNKLQQRRESMEQLYKVQRLLRKLQVCAWRYWLVGRGASLTRTGQCLGSVTTGPTAMNSCAGCTHRGLEIARSPRVARPAQTVFELPRKMRAALEEDALDTAVGLYAEAQPLLHKYGNRGTFKVRCGAVWRVETAQWDMLRGAEALPVPGWGLAARSKARTGSRPPLPTQAPCIVYPPPATGHCAGERLCGPGDQPAAEEAAHGA